MKKDKKRFYLGIFFLICLLIFPTDFNAGTVTIQTKVSGKTYNGKVMAKNPYISKTTLSLNEGKTATLKLYGTKIESVSTSDKTVAIVSKSGKVTAKKQGTATITLKGENGKSYKCKVTVKHVHKYKWKTTKQPSKKLATKLSDFGERKKICSCGKVKIKEVMINIGDRIVCGKFDDEKAQEAFNLINESRRFSVTVERDPFGNAIGSAAAYKLKEVESLNVIAKIRAAEVAIEFNHDKARTNAENLAGGQGYPKEAFSEWANSEAHFRALMNPDFTESGLANFWHDGDDSGENLYPIWVQVFEGDGLPPIEPDDTSKKIIKNDENGIPDKAFYKAAVKKYDRNGDGKLSRGEAARPGEIDLSGLGIKDITGIHYFKNATRMIFKDNKISDLSPLQKINDVFWHLDFSNNKIKSVSALKKIRVRELYLANNQISSISGLKRSGEEYFWELSIAGNSVKDISPLAGTIVQYFDWSDNGVTDISKLKKLKLKSMYGLNLSNNKITDISAINGLGTDRNPFTEVDYINLSNNKIKTLNGVIEAASIDASNNQITTLKDKSKKGSASGLALISPELNISNNKIKDLSPIGKYYGGSTNLSIDASYNSISDISGIKGIVVYELNLSHNKIKDITPLNTVQVAEVINSNDKRVVDLTYNEITTLKPLQNSKFVSSLLKRKKHDPETFYLTFKNWENKEYTNIPFNIAKGNSISLSNAKKYLPSGLLNAKLYYTAPAGIGRESKNIETPVTWISKQRFKGSPAINKEKNGIYKEDGVWVYYKNGQVDYKYWGLITHNEKKYYVYGGVADTSLNGIYIVTTDGRRHFMKPSETLDYDVDVKSIYYIRNGVVDKKFTGVVRVKAFTYENPGEYYYLTKGMWDKKYTGFGVYEEEYYGKQKLMPKYFKKGVVSASYSGLVLYENYCWRLENGIFVEDITGLIKDKKGAYGFYVDGVINTKYKGIVRAEDNGERYFVRNGYADMEYTGAFKGKEYPYEDSLLYHIEKGKVSDYSGLMDYKDDTYLMSNGVIALATTGITIIDDEPYDFIEGKVNTATKGLMYYRDNYGKNYCWMMKKGRRDTSFNGLEYIKVDFTQPNGLSEWRYFKKGKLNDSFTGYVTDEINGETADWFVIDGRFDFYTGVYIEEDSKWNGICIINGQHAEEIEGIYEAFRGSTDMWYVKDGWVQFDYTGGYLSGGYYYRITNGRVTSYSRA